ncbi:MAG: hypothetical protein KDD82_02100 [Planctomycetes bacterium]|nr:hypothetical protein [Planctomycetota bacterium]
MSEGNRLAQDPHAPHQPPQGTQEAPELAAGAPVGRVRQEPGVILVVVFLWAPVVIMGGLCVLALLLMLFGQA